MLNGSLIRGLSQEDKAKIIYGTSEIWDDFIKGSFRKTLLDIISDDCDVTSYEDVLRLTVTLNEISKMLFYGHKIGVFEEENKEEAEETIKAILKFNNILIKWLKSIKEQL